jgi:branched-chain amino acid transport system permease protein
LEFCTSLAERFATVPPTRGDSPPQTSASRLSDAKEGFALIFAISKLSDLSQYVFSGLSSGCVFALVALGFVLIANVTRVYNFAQGDYVMVGGMIVVAAHKAGWPTALAVVAAVAAVAGVALVQERTTVAPVRKHVGLLGLVVASLGFGVMLRGGALLIWGKDPLSLGSFNPGTFNLLGARLDHQTLWIWGTTIAALAGIVSLFRYTATGKAMRACAANPIAARLLGIRAERMSVAAFVLAGGLTGLVGAMIVPLAGVSWDSGVTVGLVGFIAAAIASFEYPGRAVLAGLGLGVVETLAAGEISSKYRSVIVYAVLLVYLLGRDLTGEDGVIKRLRMARATRAKGAYATAGAHRLSGAVAKLVSSKAVEQVRAQRTVRWTAAVPVALLALTALTPFILASNGNAMSSATFIVLSAIGAVGLGLVMGLAGQFSLGQAGFYLLSGYTVAILTTKHGWGPLPALLAGTGLAVAGGLLIGWLTLRLKGFNLAIATLAIHLILLVIVVQADSLTGGPLGLIGVPPLKILGVDLSGPKGFFWTALVVLGVCLLLARNIKRSRVGRALSAIGADEEGAQALGLDPFRLKLLIFVVGAGMAGVGGGLWAFYLQLAAPENWDFNLTISLVTYVVVGGVASVWGPVVGAIVVGALQYYVRFHAPSGTGGTSSDYEVIMNGAFLVFFILLFRQGLAVTFGVDRIAGWVRRARGTPRAAPATPTGAGDSS